MQRQLRWTALILAASVAADCRTATANGLFTTNIDPAARTLHQVDLSTGGAAAVRPDAPLTAGSWSGLSSLPGDGRFVYAVHNPRIPTFDSTQTSRLAKIRISDGQPTLLPLLDPAAAGLDELFSTSVAISPLNPTVAMVSGFDRFGPKVLFQADLATGAVIAGSAVELPNDRRLSALTYAPDGATLYGTDSEGLLVTVDPATGNTTTIGDPGLSDFLTGLAFRPADGALFAIEGLSHDRLLILDPVDGSVSSIVGPLRIRGPEGLAFVVPEPTGMWLVASAAISFAVRRRRQSAAANAPRRTAKSETLSS
ncbi:PEP-CTERM sorting domain-containing protein, partial [Pirellulales bacterium]|nr:PEP-CTERM sorting domain-containing protein [Pirellulales bacterium]